MKKKRVECEQHPLSLWDTLTPAERRKRKPELVDARFFVFPHVVVEGPRESPSEWPAEQEQKRLEEIVLLARWRRKHQSMGS
jgi:hypothetical protein